MIFCSTALPPASSLASCFSQNPIRWSACSRHSPFIPLVFLLAAFFGHYGDRVGRKAVLIATLLITGLATFAVGLVPTYDSIGIWGAIILTIIRFIQGIGVGGEWGGSILLSMEWARTNSHRGFITSWP